MTGASSARTFRRSSLAGPSACLIAVRWDMGRGKVRSTLTNATVARVLFCIVSGEIVLLHGFIKKTQKTPSRDIDLARGRKQELEE